MGHPPGYTPEFYDYRIKLLTCINHGCWLPIFQRIGARLQKILGEIAMKLPVIVVICACLFMFSSALHGMDHDQVNSEISQSGDEIPYLMAFSTDPSPHYVIERADGMDSRVFASGLMASDVNHVAGSGWSASGQWFAWTANALYTETNTGDRPYILNANGHTQLHALDDMNRVTMAWSSTEDILLVAGLLNPPEIVLNPDSGIFETRNDADTLTMRLGLLDPTMDSFLQVQDLPAPFERFDLLSVAFQVAWTDDNSHGLVLVNESASTTIYSIGKTGDIEITDYDAYTLASDKSGPVFSPEGEVVTRVSPDHLQLIDVTADTVNITIPPTERFINSWWSADGDKWLAHTQSPSDSDSIPGEHHLWVWSREDKCHC